MTCLKVRQGLLRRLHRSRRRCYAPGSASVIFSFLSSENVEARTTIDDYPPRIVKMDAR